VSNKNSRPMIAQKMYAERGEAM